MLKTLFESQEQLLSGLKSKNRAAFEYFYDRYSAALYGVICRIVDDRKMAGDVLQDTFLDFWQNIAFYEPENVSIFTWTLRIATIKANNYQNPDPNDPVLI